MGRTISARQDRPKMQRLVWMQMEAGVLSGAQACAGFESCTKVFRAASSSLGLPTSAPRALPQKTRIASFLFPPSPSKQPHESDGVPHWTSNTAIPRIRFPAETISPTGSVRSRFSSFQHVLQKEHCCCNVIQCSHIVAPSFLTTAVDCRTSAGVSSTINTRCILFPREATCPIYAPIRPVGWSASRFSLCLSDA